MSSTTLIRWGGLASIIGGLVVVTEHFLTLAYPWGDPPGSKSTDFLLEAMVGISAALGIVTLLAIRRLHQEAGRGYGRLGMVGFAASLAGSVVMVFNVVGILLTAGGAGREVVQSLQWLRGTLHITAMIVGLIGTIVLGIAIIRARVLPFWFGLVWIFSFLIVGLANAPGIELGYVAHALIGFILGGTLWAYADRVPVRAAPANV
jgi:hypothetical protein